MNTGKYRMPVMIDFPERIWPNNKITKAPIWCSVDLRDGNQALEVPMDLNQKVQFFDYLVKLGFKEIEIGYPAASDTEYEFTRYLIDNDLIPKDVTVQVLTMAREDVIKKTFDAAKGARSAIVHLYNSTSKLQREVVFGFDKDQCKALAIKGAQMIQAEIDSDESNTNWHLEYSPENFSETEPEFAVEIIDAVLDVWKPTPDNKVIINLPETVEMTYPNVFADQVEYFATHTKYRDSIIISVHTHNDRGTGVASSEMALLAGADRVEGTLFGNGERTGNADIVTIAMNMFMQGVDPNLDFSNIDEVIDMYEGCTGMRIGDRQPWAGRLVFTAFSGTHQNAIQKGMENVKKINNWYVPYLPIDPKDVGRNYDPIIRINSQSGKNGLAYIMERNYGLHLPKSFQKDFMQIVTAESENRHSELMPQELFELFDEVYVNVMTPYHMVGYREESLGDKKAHVTVNLKFGEQTIQVNGDGIGLLDAFCNGIEKTLDIKLSIRMYNEHAIKSGSDSAAITYVQIADKDGNLHLGAGISSSVTKSSLRAVVCALNRMIR
ncbi:MAG: 2-isopropylmalate synthase [Clostridiales bacterium]|nr:2-isopropylmalate synthase [Clostridiales bacterium]